MALCVFALIASEFMPVSLLTPIATDLHVSEGVAGQGIAVSGAFAVLTSLLLPALARQTDRKVIDAAVPEIAAQLDALELAYGERDYLVGNTVSMADLFFAPIAMYLEMFPETKALLDARPNIQRGQAAMRARPSYAATMPQLG